MSEKTIPQDVTAEERWIVKNRVQAIRVEYRQTGTDTADTFVHLTPSEGKPVCWKDSTFRKVARLELGYATVVEPHYGVRDRVEAREKWEKANARELAEYRRLKAKFEGGRRWSLMRWRSCMGWW